MKDDKRQVVDPGHLNDLVFGQSERANVSESLMQMPPTSAVYKMPSELLYSFLRQTPSPCYVKDSDGNFVFVNESFELAFQTTGGELTGTKSTSWLPQALHESWNISDENVLIEPRDVLEPAIWQDGTSRSFTFWKFVFYNDAGEKYMGATAFDVYQMQASNVHLRGQAELLELILNNIGDPVIAVDATGKLLLFNPAAIRLYGMGIIGNSQTKPTDRYGLFLPDGSSPYPKEDLPLSKAIRGETVLDQEIFVRTPDAPLGTFLSAKAQPILDGEGNLKGGAAVFRDITARKRVEEELQNTVRQLKEARDEAIQASDLKSQFVANISHELRTPMSGVLGMTELLLGMPLQDEQKELATFIYESAGNLLTVLNELLDFSRLEAGKLTLEEGYFSPRRVVEEVAASVKLSAARKGLSVVSEVDEKLSSEVYGDFRRIKQVLQHIVQNALKFTEKGSITISASLEKQVGDLAHVRFAVKDTGIGMSAEALESVFAPFVQADGSSTRKYGGIGLGLSISKRLVKIMSGTLTAQSKPEEGSVFWFMVPLQISGSEHANR